MNPCMFVYVRAVLLFQLVKLPNLYLPLVYLSACENVVKNVINHIFHRLSHAFISACENEISF